jgi:hypothetical protein
LVVVGLLIFVVLKLTGCNSTYAEGSRVGVLTKYSSKGVVFKSGEGTLQVMGADATNVGMAASQWDFSVRNNDIEIQLNQALQNGTRVRIHYRQWFVGPMQIDTKYEVVRVESLGK